MAQHHDPLIRKMRKAYKGTRQFKIDQLLKERQKWQRRETIARNKLAEIRYEFDLLATQWASEGDTREKIEFMMRDAK